VVRQGSAKPSFPGSIPGVASSFPRLLAPQAWLFGVAVTATVAVGTAYPQTSEPELVATDGWSDAEKEEFLAAAEIIDQEVLPTGVTESLRATLSDGLYTHDAHIQTVDLYRKKFKTPRRTHLDFHDSYRYNIAAYRVDRLLGLQMVPVSVERRVWGKRAAVTWWIDDVAMSVLEKHRNGVEPPDLQSWNRQRFLGRLFNQLIGNIDAHLGNHLVTSEWKLWLVDFTRAFRPHRKLPSPEELGCVDRNLYESLQGLTSDLLGEATGDVLSGRERKSVLARRDRLVEHYDRRLETEGEAHVFCRG
jgi:hypothetical protein